ncbi:MAG TPA: hypothetical protein DER64_09690, partial [Planctomycetaceae bacterium]|nr:hypothetical protein [Planctomycetaceae bacterium]
MTQPQAHFDAPTSPGRLIRSLVSALALGLGLCAVGTGQDKSPQTTLDAGKAVTKLTEGDNLEKKSGEKSDEKS